MLIRNLTLCTALTISLGASNTSFSATITNNFTAAPDIIYPMSLISTTSGLNQLPPLTVNVGDTFKGVIDFSDSLTIPASSGSGNPHWYMYLNLYENGDPYQHANYNASIEFFQNATPVIPPPGFGQNQWGGCCGSVGFGLITNVGDPSFTFNKLVYSVNITGITSETGTLIEFASAPTLGVQAWYTTAPSVPIPASAWLFLSGLSCLGGLGRKKCAA